MKKCGKKRKINDVIRPIIQPSNKKQNINTDFNHGLTDDILKRNDYKLLNELTYDELILECLKRGLRCTCNEYNNRYNHALKDIRIYINSKKDTKCCLPIVLMIDDDGKNSYIYKIFNDFVTFGELTLNKLETFTKKLKTFNIFGYNNSVCNGVIESSQFIQCIDNIIAQCYQSTMDRGRLHYLWNDICLLILFYIICEYYSDYEDKSWDILCNLNNINNDIKGCIFDFAFDNMKWYKNYNNKYFDKCKLIFIVFVYYHQLSFEWQEWIGTNVYIPNDKKSIIHNYLIQYNSKHKHWKRKVLKSVVSLFS